MYRLASLLLLCLPFSAVAQDTLHVQTLTYDSITTRRGIWAFPDSTHTFRKVLMHHTLKCDPATTADSYNCGEWDYLTYNFIHRHTGVMDSTAQQHPFFLVGAAAPDSADRLNALAYDGQQRWNEHPYVVSFTTETPILLGANTEVDSMSFRAGAGTIRSQYLYPSTMLSAAGLLSLPINQLRFTLTNNNGMARVIVRMANTPVLSLSTFNEAGLITVADEVVDLVDPNLVLTLRTPFVWDGISSVLVDLAVELPDPAAGAWMQASIPPGGQGVQQAGADHFVELKNDFIGGDAGAFAALSNAVTITFRCKGDTSLPFNTSILEALDAQGRRVLNIHLPWSNSRIYWDAGNTGASYDRIDKAATAADIEGQWINWAFTKNAGTGQMKIYRNGTLWHSGTGMTKPMSGIASWRIGSGGNGQNPWSGSLDDLNIFATEVTAPNIATWAGRKVDASHPNYADLIHSFGFDDPIEADTAMNSAAPGSPAWLMGTVRRDRATATALRGAEVQTSIVPDITFVQGDHVIDIDSTIVEQPVPGEHLAIQEFAVAGNGVVPEDTLFGALGRDYVTYDPAGDVIASTPETGTIHYNDTLDYYGVPFELIDNYEIGRYITPYGIGLTLGPQGFRWTFDVTDYQWLLHDSVDLSAGNNQELIDLEFEMIEGVPPRELMIHKRPWGPMGSKSYASLDNDTQLPPVTVPLDPAVEQWSLRSRLTGHGHNSNDGSYPHCCEWKDNTHFVYVNGSEVDEWHIWQTNDCALNPVYPQGGTWLGAREGWCPGDLVDDHVTELSGIAGTGSATLDYRITPVPSSNLGMGGGNYVVNMDLFGFSAPTHALDAEVYTVKRPTDADVHRRENPICVEPVVTLRNAGATDLTSAIFTYHVSGGVNETYTWNGLLKHMESEDVSLPLGSGWFWSGDSAQLFTVTVSAPNGGTDDHADNNSYTTHFDLPAIYANTFILQYKTNNLAYENSVVIKDLWGTAVYQQDWGALGNNVTKSDTLDLTPGCYTLEVLDEGNDGFSYWADPGAGSGYLRFKNIGGSIFKTFQPEFGRSIHHAFAISDIVGMSEPAQAAAISAIPNPNNGRFLLELQGIEGPARIDVIDARGTVVQSRVVDAYAGLRLEEDLQTVARGLYVVRVTNEGRAASVRLVIE